MVLAYSFRFQKPTNAKPETVGLKWPPGKLTSTRGFSQRRPRKPVLMLRTLVPLIQSNGFEHDTRVSSQIGGHSQPTRSLPQFLKRLQRVSTLFCSFIRLRASGEPLQNCGKLESVGCHGTATGPKF